MLNRSLVTALRLVAPVREAEPLSRHTTLGIGGPADLYVKVATVGVLVRVLDLAHQFGLPWWMLGAGSNVLVGDDGIRGIVVEYDAKAVRGPTPLPDGGVRFRVEAGASLAGVARRLSREGYAGMEWAVGIPGTFGGAVVTNAGAHGVSLSDNLAGVQVAQPGVGLRDIPVSAFDLAYRESVFTRGGMTNVAVASVALDLHADDPTAIAVRVAQNDAHRLTAQPPGRNTGSMFKNPTGESAWRLIDAVGLRGARCGGAQITPKHTNFFQNTGGARAAEVVTLMHLAAARVRDRFGIELEPEVRLVGEGFTSKDGSPLPVTLDPAFADSDASGAVLPPDTATAPRGAVTHGTEAMR